MADGEDKSNDLAFIGYQDNGDIDNLYGSSTFLRRMDNYEKEYDQLTAEEKLARQYDLGEGPNGFKIYKKANGDIALLDPSADKGNQDGTPKDDEKTPKGDGSDPGNGDLGDGKGPNASGAGQNGPAVLGPTDPSAAKPTWKDRLAKMRTEPMFLAALRQNTHRTNARVRDLGLQQRVPLKHTARKADSQFGDYTYQNAILQQQAATNQMGSNLMSSTSDLTQGLSAALQAHEMNHSLAQNAALHQAEVSNNELKEGVETGNYNKAVAADDANVNRNALVAQDNANLNTLAQYAAAEGQANEQWMTANRQSEVKANIDDQMEQYNKMKMDLEYGKDGNGGYYGALQKAYNTYADTQDFNKYKGYTDLFDKNGNLKWSENDISEGGKYQNLYNWKLQNGDIGQGDQIAFSKKDLEDYMLTEQGQKDFGYLQDGFNRYAEQGYNDYIKKQQELDIQHRHALGRITPLSFNGEWPMFYRQTPKVSFAKQGGSIKKSVKKARFLDYLEHNRKTLDQLDKRVEDSSKRSQHLLERDLNAFDRETLLLLHSVFK